MLLCVILTGNPIKINFIIYFSISSRSTDLILLRILLRLVTLGKFKSVEEIAMRIENGFR